jgi:hypothetical protein
VARVADFSSRAIGVTCAGLFDRKVEALSKWTALLLVELLLDPDPCGRRQADHEKENHAINEGMVADGIHTAIDESDRRQIESGQAARDQRQQAAKQAQPLTQSHDKLLHQLSPSLV